MEMASLRPGDRARQQPAAQTRGVAPALGNPGPADGPRGAERVRQQQRGVELSLRQQPQLVRRLAVRRRGAERNQLVLGRAACLPRRAARRTPRPRSRSAHPERPRAPPPSAGSAITASPASSARGRQAARVCDRSCALRSARRAADSSPSRRRASRPGTCPLTVSLAGTSRQRRCIHSHSSG